MAKTIEELFQEFIDKQDGSSNSVPSSTLEKLEAAFAKATKASAAFSKSIELDTSEVWALHDAQTAQKTGLLKLNEQFKAGKITTEQYRRGLAALENEVDSLTETTGELNKESAKTLKHEIELGKDQAKRKQNMEDLRKSFSGLNVATKGISGSFSALGKIGAAVGGVVKQIQDGGSGAAVASGALTAGIDVANSAAQTTASAITTVGGAMKGKFGPALQIGGAALAAFSSAVSDAAKFAIGVLTKEVEKQTESYHTMASAGALFSNGMGDMMNSSIEAGLSIKTMSNIVKGNSEALYKSGLNIADATKKISKTFQSGGDQFKGSLLNLGYSLEEQGGLVAETMSNLRLAGRSIKDLSGGEIAEATKSYAINLKTISAITGDDAKKRMDQAREAMANAAVQAKLNSMTSEQRTKFQEGLATVHDSLKSAVLQQRVLGTVVDKNVNIMMASVPGMANNIKGMANNLENGATAVSKYQEQIAGQLADANKEGSATAAMGVAGLVGLSGAASDTSSAFAKLFLEIQKGANKKGDSEEILAAAKAMSNTTNETTQTLSKLQIQGEMLSSQLEGIVNKDLLGKFGKMLEATNQKMAKALGEAGKAIDQASGTGTWWDKNGRDIIKYAGTTIGAGIGGVMMSPTIAGVGVGVATGGMAGAGLSESLADYLGLPKNPAGKKDGGISSGSPSGFLEKLHGTELIVPMDNGKIDTNSFGYAELIKSIGLGSFNSTNQTSGSLGSVNNMTSILNSSSRASSATYTSTDLTNETIAKDADRKEFTDTKTKSDQTLIDEIKKVSERLLELTKLTEDSINQQKQLIGLTSDHKNISDRIFKATV